MRYKAVWHDTILAEAEKDDLVYIEGNWYFPPSSVRWELLRESPTPYTCPWKGDCQYFDVDDGKALSKDAAWCYPALIPSAIERVHRDFTGYVAFWHDVEVIP